MEKKSYIFPLMERTAKQFEESQKYYAMLEFVMCTCSSVDMHDETHFKPVWIGDALNCE